ncbi:hypothetical protein [Streptomyces sp. NPDC005752]|uniref:hypothetical protein n=1 Tax=Streptomyces sp. NPDC005752 TaxID=3157065 RepID=UPI0033C772CC
MRKFASMAVTAIVMGGSLGLTAGQAAANSGAEEVQPLASCVTVSKWSTGANDRYVTVKNSCASTKCFTVTMALRTDPKFSIGANKTQEFRYGGMLGVSGTGIKNVGC